MNVDRELLLEIGCEELPASWLPGLTNQIGEVVARQLREHRLAAESPVETFSTPRRLAVRVAKVPERQTDLEELVNGPAVSAGFKPDGTPTPAAAGFAAKQGVEVSALERVATPKGEYLAFRRRQRGKTAVDVLPDVLTGTLRGMSFPKSMHWDAMLEDGRGELLFGRPIRWILYVYGGRVVPFVITRTSAAQSSQVQDVVSGAVTYGHRFLTTSGRAGRSIKVRTFDDYRARLLENFVILERGERHDKIARELDAKAVRLKARVSRIVHSESDLLDEVPDLVEYPSVIAGTFASEFTDVLPPEVLTTTLIHHQHYFPVEGEDGHLKPAFLAVINTEPENERTIARNAERVVTARLRDAMFFWEADRRVTLASRIDRLSTLLFHKKLGTYAEKASRLEQLSAWVAREAFGAPPEGVAHAALAGKLAKSDLTSDMVREFSELQGTMGGIYAREEGLPEEVWKAVYFHYLPAAIESSAPPTRAQLGKAAVTWAAVALADKLDTVVGLFAAGERPTGSRDPYGLRRAANGVIRILADLPELTGLKARVKLGGLLDAAEKLASVPCGPEDRVRRDDFLLERVRGVLEARGFSTSEVRAVTAADGLQIGDASPLEALWRAEALREVRGAEDFQQLAVLFKRAKNVVRDRFGPVPHRESWKMHAGRLTEDAERALRAELDRRGPELQDALDAADYKRAVRVSSMLAAPVDRLFKEVFVMAEDEQVRDARLSLLLELRDLILSIGDVSEIAVDAG